MHTMLVAIFETTPHALKGVLELRNLDRTGEIALYASAVISKDPSGKVSVKQASEREFNGVIAGLLSGVLIGTWGGPVGLAIGGLIGGLAGLIIDLAQAGTSVDFLEESSRSLAPGKAAILAEIDETSVASVNMRLEKLGGLIYRRPRSEFVEDQLVDELTRIRLKLQQLQAELTHGNAENKSFIQAASSDEEKAETRQHIAGIRADYETRQAKVKRILASFREAVTH